MYYMYLADYIKKSVELLWKVIGKFYYFSCDVVYVFYMHPHCPMFLEPVARKLLSLAKEKHTFG